MYFFLETNRWVVKKDSLTHETYPSPGDYYLGVSGDTVDILAAARNKRNLLVGQRVTSIYKNRQQETYTSIEEFVTITASFFKADIFSLLSSDGFMAKAALGKVYGVSHISKFGENPDIGITSTPEDLWNQGGVYTYSNTADIDSVSSESPGDIIDVVIEGLDENNLEISQTVTLDGNNRVPIPIPFIIVHRAYCKGEVPNIGTVYIFKNTPLALGVPIDKSTIRGAFTSESRQTEMAIYRVPAGKTGLYYEGFVAVSRGSDGNAEMTLKTRLPGGVFRVKRRVAVNSGGSSHWRAIYSIPKVITEMTDIKFTCESVSANKTGVSGGFEMLVLDNSFWGL